MSRTGIRAIAVVALFIAASYVTGAASALSFATGRPELTRGPIALADSRLYRHCHIVGSRAFVRCMTADPWSPERMELDRRAGRLNHEGGPKDKSMTVKVGFHCHPVGINSYCFERDPPQQQGKRHPYDCPIQTVRRSFRSHVELTCPSG